ncbi:AcvB/VirJ family lysyl-phosphatidylglycerol hydrolase [Sphingomonadaceae bacterium jetA1]|jgi:type IV secretory pathway VirJ component|uniref:AcvB/VirJ family lysyl-phosphatidylglycerol hydrolase n=1 Tax=Facivitalis istanbulensis TaxID=3075838 RepID=UPI00346BB29F
MPAIVRSPRHLVPRLIAAFLGLIVLIAVALLYSGSYFSRDPITRYPARGTPQPILVLSFSGDMGLRYGMSGVVADGLSAAGIEVAGVNSPVLFRLRRTRIQIDALITGMVRRAVEEAGDRRLVLLGQSYGSDLLQTGLAHLPADLRRRVAGIILVVPGDTVFFRSDPSGIAYQRRPDAMGIKTARTLTWAPLTCIYGMAEKDSLCPLLKGGPARLIAMPGGHYLDHDDPALVARILATVRADAATARKS